VAQYGEDLVCVRYRYDRERTCRFVTVELIVAQRPWQFNEKRIPRNTRVSVRIGYEESHLRRVVKAAGGKWNPAKKAWEVPYGEVLDLGLTDRIVAG
jgi:hypothetical protein